MIFEEKTIELKNGTTAILRNPRREDAQALIDYLVTVCGETDFLAAYPEERQGMPVQAEENWIEQGVRSERSLMILCEIGGEIAGLCGLNFYGSIKARHRSTVDISILQKYWSLGIGTAMLRELIAAAEAHAGTEIMELEVLEGNERAIALYEKMGFSIISERPDAYRLKDGSRRAEIYMQKRLTAKK